MARTYDPTEQDVRVLGRVILTNRIAALPMLALVNITRSWVVVIACSAALTSALAFSTVWIARHHNMTLRGAWSAKANDLPRA